MKHKLLNIVTAVTLLMFPTVIFAQAPNLGTAANFALFSSTGAVTDIGTSHVTGNVGANIGSATGFGNVNGQMHVNDLVTGQCFADLLIAYGELNLTVNDFFPAPLLGNGATLVPGVYSISGAATLNGSLTLDGQGNANAVFIIKVGGAFSSAALSQVVLTNGTQACNVFWKIEGLVSLASGTKMKGTVIANNAAIDLNSNVELEGRALSTAGAISAQGILVYTPSGCGSPLLNGPAAPALNSTACYAIFSTNGPVTNSDISIIKGDVGTNVGLTTGFDPLNVTGTVHPIPDVSTDACATDLNNVYLHLLNLPYDIELLYPAQFGNNLVLTPHTYLLNAATSLTDTIVLDAQGNANAVFVIQINGALSTSTNAFVKLINGTKAKNIYWKVDGAVDLSVSSNFKGTIVANNGAVNLSNGVTIDGRVFSTTGAITTQAVNVSINSTPSSITAGGPITFCQGGSVLLTANAADSYLWSTGEMTQSISVTSSGNYTVTATIINECASASDTVSVTVNQLPIVSISADGALTQCDGNTIILTSSVATGNVWSPSGAITTSISVTTSNNYMVTVTDANGCTNTANALVTFNTCGVAPTQLRAIDCGKINLIPNAQIACIPVLGATNYEWEFRDILNNAVMGTAITNWYVVTTAQVSPTLAWNTQYNCRVRAKVGGLWGSFSGSCRIGLRENPAIDGVVRTQLRAPFCNASNLALSSIIACSPVSMASNYEFEFTDLANAQVILKQNSSNYLGLNTITPALQQGHTYAVRVRAFVYNTWSDFGSSCTINISNAAIAAREYAIEVDEEGNETITVKEVLPSLDLAINAYPNPFNNEGGFTVNAATNTQVAVTLFDAVGNRVWQKQVNSNTYIHFESSELANGMYLLSATDNNGLNKSIRLIKTD